MRARDGLIWRQWDDEYVVYNPESGDTHLLDFVSAQGLLLLEQREASAGELEKHLNVTLTNVCGEDLRQEDLKKYVQELIAELAELGLTR